MRKLRTVDETLGDERMRQIAYYDPENGLLYYCAKNMKDIKDGTSLVNCQGCPNLIIKKILKSEPAEFKDNGEWK